MTNKVLNGKYNVYRNLFFFTLAYLAIIDSFNGFLIKNYDISISSIYRAIMLTIFFYYANKGNKSYRNIYIYVVFIYMLIIGLINTIRFDEILGIKSEIIGISKFLFIVVLIESFRNCVRNRDEGLKLIEKIINYNLILFPSFLIIPMILNLGSNVYAGGLGSKGFFYSNNELSIVVSILFIFAIDKLYNNFSLKNLSILLLVGISLLSIGSKTGMIIPMIISIIYLIKSFIDKENRQKFRNFMIIAILGSLIILIFICPNLISEFINRQLYLYSIDGGSILYAILSGRNEFLSIIYVYFVESNHKIMTLIFGYGEYVKNRIIASGLSSEYNPGVLKSIEMDFFDIVFGYGIIGVILVYGYFIEAFIKNYSLKKERFKYTIAFISIMFLGFLSGHIFYSAMSGSMLAIVTCGLVFSNPNYKFKDRSKYEKDILLVSNMYPNKKNPSFGIFVKNTKKILNKQGYSTEQIVIKKTTGKFKKIYIYIKHYVCVIVKGTIKNYKCIYVHYISHNAIPILILKKIKPKTKVCINIHGSDINPRNSIEKILDKVTGNLLPLAESIIVPSEYYKNIVIKKYKINKEKVHVFPKI
ncbi:O-antigen ligase family protein [Paraclostridium benzoelyticum]|uniref:O-antigen ligase family protein n=1 Tax=Paraclostridium benzoelyticum TaxID=1629550 RepID=UPI00069C6EDC|nr:O-antigen ligase family protein [Paraclostridium benzoelyticum]